MRIKEVQIYESKAQEICPISSVRSFQKLGGRSGHGDRRRTGKLSKGPLCTTDQVKYSQRKNTDSCAYESKPIRWLITDSSKETESQKGHWNMVFKGFTAQ